MLVGSVNSVSEIADRPYYSSSEVGREAKLAKWERGLSVMTCGLYAACRSSGRQAMRSAHGEQNVDVSVSRDPWVNRAIRAIIERDMSCRQEPSAHIEGAKAIDPGKLDRKERAIARLSVFENILTEDLRAGETTEARLDAISALPEEYKTELKKDSGIDLNAICNTFQKRWSVKNIFDRFTRKIEEWNAEKHYNADQLLMESSLSLQWALHYGQIWSQVSEEMSGAEFMDVIHSFGDSARETQPPVEEIRERLMVLRILKEELARFDSQDIVTAVAHCGARLPKVEVYLEKLMIFRRLKEELPDLTSAAFEMAVLVWEKSHPQESLQIDEIRKVLRG